MIRHFSRRFALLCMLAGLAGILGGCAVVETHRYADVTPDLQFEGARRVAVAICDHRPYVTANDFRPDFTGVVLGLFGNAYPVSTASGKSLAEEMTLAVCRGLNQKGFEAIPVSVSPLESQALAQEKVEATGAANRILIEIHEWKSSTYIRSSVTYDLTMAFQEAKGNKRAQLEYKGREFLGGSLLHPYQYGRQAVPRFFKKMFEEALNKDDVQEMLH